jgi:hypothetical protein
MLKPSTRQEIQVTTLFGAGRPQRKQSGPSISQNLLRHEEQIMGPNLPHAAQAVGNRKSFNLFVQKEGLLGPGSVNIGLRIRTQNLAKNVFNKFPAF